MCVCVCVSEKEAVAEIYHGGGCVIRFRHSECLTRRREGIRAAPQDGRTAHLFRGFSPSREALCSNRWLRQDSEARRNPGVCEPQMNTNESG